MSPVNIVSESTNGVHRAVQCALFSFHDAARSVIFSDGPLAFFAVVMSLMMYNCSFNRCVRSCSFGAAINRSCCERVVCCCLLLFLSKNTCRYLLTHHRAVSVIICHDITNIYCLTVVYSVSLFSCLCKYKVSQKIQTTDFLDWSYKNLLTAWQLISTLLLNNYPEAASGGGYVEHRKVDDATPVL